MNCLLCGQTTKSELTFSSLFLLKHDCSYLCSACDSTFEKIGEDHCPNCMKTRSSTKCQDCKFWCKEGIQVDHNAFSVAISLMAIFCLEKFLLLFLLRS